ncbi:hypothetical protein HELRODRAFT_194929 [Helobdella robusta]|uniref:Uncharacterized protein n=1 Tax=Helobdella robusta TaxID=6412 RepID=T1FWK9_HELRO|nr:hypothetical protein HELRODRAFT_194929 [Helobdella robusta]ESO10416.1 hypothetical protein HELRODRAFT_194929 [Helobdella robusta]
MSSTKTTTNLNNKENDVTNNKTHDTNNENDLNNNNDDGSQVTSTSPKEATRFLTAKYPKHQMGLIRKRLAVEDWMDEQLKMICGSKKQCIICALHIVGRGNFFAFKPGQCNVEQNAADSYDGDLDLDLDEIIDLEDERERYDFVKEKLSCVGVKCNDNKVNLFIEDLLEKINAL